MGCPERGTPGDRLCLMVIAKHILYVLQGERGHSHCIGGGFPPTILRFSALRYSFSIVVLVFNLVCVANMAHGVMWLRPHPLVWPSYYSPWFCSMSLQSGFLVTFLV